MKRLIIICEGPTEAEFCKDVLAPALLSHDILIETPLIKHSGGGIVPWESLKRQIEGHLLHEQNAFVTMLIDYYGIKDNHKFPLWEESKQINNPERIHALCQGMAKEIREEVRHHFIPYIQLHEFEGLLFSDVTKFKNWYDSDKMSYKDLESAYNQFPNPELINNDPQTAPSKRLIAAIPSYNKVLDGNCIAMDIGLDKIRVECPLFNEWVTKLEKLN